jgi:hypothetical protein
VGKDVKTIRTFSLWSLSQRFSCIELHLPALSVIVVLTTTKGKKMYGLPDSAIYGTYKRAKRSMRSAKRVSRDDNTTFIYKPKATDKAESDSEFISVAVLLPIMALGKLFDFIGFLAERIGNRAERWDRKMRAKRARQMLDAEKKVS